MPLDDEFAYEPPLTPIAHIPRYVTSHDLFSLTFALCMRPDHPIAAAQRADRAVPERTGDVVALSGRHRWPARRQAMGTARAIVAADPALPRA